MNDNTLRVSTVLTMEDQYDDEAVETIKIGYSPERGIADNRWTLTIIRMGDKESVIMAEDASEHYTPYIVGNDRVEEMVTEDVLNEIDNRGYVYTENGNDIPVEVNVRYESEFEELLNSLESNDDVSLI